MKWQGQTEEVAEMCGFLKKVNPRMEETEVAVLCKHILEELSFHKN